MFGRTDNRDSTLEKEREQGSGNRHVGIKVKWDQGGKSRKMFDCPCFSSYFLLLTKGGCKNSRRIEREERRVELEKRGHLEVVREKENESEKLQK